jgi:hypothetical protein
MVLATNSTWYKDGAGGCAVVLQRHNATTSAAAVTQILLA